MSNLGVEVSINDIGKIPHWKCHSYWAIDPRLKENDMVLDYISDLKSSLFVKYIEKLNFKLYFQPFTREPNDRI